MDVDLVGDAREDVIDIREYALDEIVEIVVDVKDVVNDVVADAVDEIVDAVDDRGRLHGDSSSAGEMTMEGESGAEFRLPIALEEEEEEEKEEGSFRFQEIAINID